MTFPSISGSSDKVHLFYWEKSGSCKNHEFSMCWVCTKNIKGKKMMQNTSIKQIAFKFIACGSMKNETKFKGTNYALSGTIMKYIFVI